ncbi:MAG: DNA primase, partial [Turicibacter sp.]
MSKGRIPKELFDEVIRKNDIADVVSDYVQLTKAGKNYKGLCPFHGENTPSFVVSPDKGIYKCFGCGEGGNVVSFVSQLEGLNYPETIMKLVKRAGINTDFTLTTQSSSLDSKFKTEYDVLEFSKGFYHYYLNHTKEGKIALQYLLDRGMTIESIEKFGIGLAPSHQDALVKTLDHNKYSLPLATQVGLINEHQNRFYDRFKSRIMFPIADKMGKVVGFSGRIFGDQDASLGKYVNSPETPLFQKGKLVYNLSEAKMSIRRHNQVLLFEGFLDVISAVEAGFLQSVATMGTAFTEDHARELRRLTDQVIICYDGDKAGFAAANKAIPILMAQNFSISVLDLPLNLDPDEYIKKYGSDAFSKLVKQAIPAVDYQYLYIKKQFNLDFVSHRDQFKTQIFRLIETLPSPTLKELLLKKLAQDIAIGYESIFAEFSNGKSQVYKNSNIIKNKYVNTQTQNQNLRDTKYDRSEKMLIHYMLKDRNVAQKVEKELNGYLNDPVRRNIALYILDYYTSNESMDIQYFMNWIDDALIK